jgi:oligoribonuclease NrnB/cAMP/cGMP phosphodiesterase (DHH superfamily)
MTQAGTLLTFAPDIVLYHAECADGFGAAWAIWKRYPSARFLPVKHGEPPPSGLSALKVVMVDFSYPRPILEVLAADSKTFLILDHHITAQQALQGLPYAYFDQQKSGAVLAWEWAHRSQAPWLLRYIQDKDLWEWTLPFSREVSAAIAAYPYDFHTWDRFDQERLIQEGTAILRYERELVNKIAAHAVLVTFHGYRVPAVQSAVLTSQIGEQLSDGYPFCIIWHDRNGRRYCSFRSREDGVDVGSLAASLGGGGHTHAAGFSVPLGPDGMPPPEVNFVGPPAGPPRCESGSKDSSAPQSVSAVPRST